MKQPERFVLMLSVIAILGGLIGYHVDTIDRFINRCNNRDGFEMILVNEFKGSYAQFLAVSPSAHLIATSDANNHDLCFLDPATGREVKRIPGHVERGVFGTTKYFALVRAEQLEIWNTQTWELVAHDAEDTPSPYAITFADQDTWLCLGTESGKLGLLNLGTGEYSSIPHAHALSIDRLASTSKGQRIASGGQDGTVHIWNVATRKREHSLALGRPVRFLCFSSDDDYLAVGIDARQIVLFDSGSWTEVCRMNGAKFLMYDLCFLGSRPLLVSFGSDGYNRAFRVHRCSDGKTLFYKDTPWGSRPHVATNPDGDLIFWLSFPSGKLSTWRISE